MTILDSRALRQAKAVRAKLNEIEIRYANEVKWRPTPNGADITFKELSKLFSLRYGDVLPDDDAGREDLYLIAQHQRPNVLPRLTAFASLRAPWMTHDDIVTMAADVIANPRWYSAEELGQLVRLTTAERDTLNITRFRAHNVTWEEMQAERKRKDKERKAATRRNAGAKPQAESLERLEPWKADGISRRTYYRRKKKQSASTLAADELVPRGTVSSPPIKTRNVLSILGITSPARGHGHIRVKLSGYGMSLSNHLSMVLPRARLARCASPPPLAAAALRYAVRSMLR